MFQYYHYGYKYFGKYKWYSKTYPFFKLFHNPYKFGILNFIKYKIIETELYKRLMVQYYKKHPEKLEDYEKLTDYNFHDYKIISNTYQYKPNFWPSGFYDRNRK